MIKRLLSCAASALLLSAALSPAPAAARDWGNISGWYVTSGATSCGMYSGDPSRFIAGGRGTEIVILKRLDGYIYMQANNLSWAIPRGAEAAAFFQIDDARFNGATNIASLAAYPGRGLIAVFDIGFEDALRNGKRLSIMADGRALTEINLEGSAAAFATIQSCLDDLRSGGGIGDSGNGDSGSSDSGKRDITATAEPAAAGFASLATPPKAKGNPGEWIQLSDYPDNSDTASGTTRFTLSIGVDGRVTACTITQSSGHPSLDEATCKAMTRRARFEAATDASGNKVPGSYTNKAVWVAQRGER